MRVRVLATGLATYPDVTVVCGPLERDAESRSTVVNPRVLVEVLSDSTEAYDRGEKLEHYRQIPGLEAVVLISHRDKSLEVFERRAENTWAHKTLGPGEIVVLDAIPVRLAVDEIYAAAREPGA